VGLQQQQQQTNSIGIKLSGTSKDFGQGWRLSEKQSIPETKEDHWITKTVLFFFLPLNF